MPEERETALSATSVDGLHFTLDVPVERLALGVGGYVVVGDGGSERLAYTTEVALEKSPNAMPELCTWWIENGPAISTSSPSESVRATTCFVSWSAMIGLACGTRP